MNEWGESGRGEVVKGRRRGKEQRRRGVEALRRE
jgi:hypothetical protein